MTQRFLHLSATDSGGAGQAAARLHDGLRTAGYGSRMFVLDRLGDDPDIIAFGKRGFRTKRLLVKAALKVFSKSDYYFQNQSLRFSSLSELIAMAIEYQPSVIVAHFISHYLSFEDVLAIHRATGAPVIWHLLDMASLTGGCHYAWSCDRYQSACGECPALRLRGKHDVSAGILRDKRAASLQISGAVAAGSSKLAAEAGASTLFRDSRLETVLLGVSPDQFSPVRRATARRSLNLPPEGVVIFFGAQRFDQRRKGMGILLEALIRLGKTRDQSGLPVLLLAGDSSDMGLLTEVGYVQRRLGFVDTETLATAYAAADLFVCPSIEDSGPMMVNEALMSGTPVVGFRMGVIPDLVTPGVTGEIAETMDADSLLDAIVTALGWCRNSPESTVASCRSIALEKCHPHVQVQGFVDIAGSLTTGRV